MQDELDQIEVQLQQLRKTLTQDREQAAAQLTEMIEQTGGMTQRAKDTDFEPAVSALHDLLQSLHRGVCAQQSLASVPSGMNQA